MSIEKGITHEYHDGNADTGAVSEQGAAGSEEKPSLSPDRAERERQRQREIEAAPFVVLTVKSSGIHPSTARVVVVDAITLDPDGNQVEDFYAVLNPAGDPGPVHLHGLTHEQVAEGKRFSQILKPLGRLIDGRTLIVHNTAATWGFIVAEARRAMSNAARSNRTRGRGRGRRRQRVGHVPQPALIVDTLATARRLGLQSADTRVRAVAADLGLEAPVAQASVQRAAREAFEVTREETMLTARVFFVEHARGILAQTTPDALRADRFGLQRSHIRVDAPHTPAPENPGVYSPEQGLVAGMEFVIAPEISMDPDLIIEAGLREGLSYSEKITRKSSVVVCNKRENLVGKAMHADRKQIPLLSDEEFLAAILKKSQAEN